MQTVVDFVLKPTRGRAKKLVVDITKAEDRPRTTARVDANLKSLGFSVFRINADDVERNAAKIVDGVIFRYRPLTITQNAKLVAAELKAISKLYDAHEQAKLNSNGRTHAASNMAEGAAIAVPTASRSRRGTGTVARTAQKRREGHSHNSGLRKVGTRRSDSDRRRSRSV